MKVLPAAKVLTGVCMCVSFGGISIPPLSVTKPASSFHIPEIELMLPANLCYMQH